MNKSPFLVVGLVLLLGGSAYAVDADNTQKNARDKNGTTLTAQDQGSSEADRNITAAIRKSIVGDDNLSMNAHNVKIITNSGVVTLRGPVDSSAEKSKVEAFAKGTSGVKRVDSHIEINRD